MCYNSTGQANKTRCTLTFFGEEPFTAAGYWQTEGEKLRLSCLSDGDELTVECEGKTVFYRRRGSLDLAMRLTEGEHTACILTEGERRGEIPVYTALVRLRRTEQGVELWLQYNLGGNRTHLHIAAALEN